MNTKKYAVEFSKTVWRIIEVEIEIEEEDRPFVNESLAEDKAIQVLMDEGAFGDGWEADSVWEVEAPDLTQKERDAIALRIAALNTEGELK